jgi:ketosteroid isomerase-like protein
MIGADRCGDVDRPLALLALSGRRDTGRAMSQENVNRALELLDAFNRRDLDAFTALTHDQIEVESRLVAMEGGYHGHEGLRRWWEDFLGAFPDYSLEVEELRDLGDVTIGHMRGWGHGADSTTPLVDPFWIPMRWRDGKIIWWRNCATEADALEAVGLSE